MKVNFKKICPKYQHLNMYFVYFQFIRAIFVINLKLFNINEVKFINIPPYGELAVKKYLP